MVYSHPTPLNQSIWPRQITITGNCDGCIGHNGCILDSGETEDKYPRANLSNACSTTTLPSAGQIWKTALLEPNLEEN